MASLSSLRTNSWDAVYTYITTKDATPAVPISTTHVHSTMNSKLVGAENYPQVAINTPTLEVMKVTVDGRTVQANIFFFIEIYTTSAQTVKSLADEVMQRMLDGRSYFMGERMCNMTFEGDDYSTWDDGDKKIHRISMNISFRFIGDY